MKWYRDKYLYLSMGLCFCLAFLSFLPFIIKGKGLFSLCVDYDNQQIPFTVGLINALKSGNTEWQWNVSLGSDMFESYGFYALGSVFFWIAYLFGARMFPYTAVWIYMLKYAVAAASAYLYLRRYAKKRYSAIAGAVLYAFSGFQCENLVFYHFHDVVAFFPLMLLGLDKLVDEGKKGFFAVAVTVNGMTNYFFLPGELIFCVIYFFCREWDSIEETVHLPRRIAGLVYKGRYAIVECLIGIGCSAWILLPSALSLMSNPRTDNVIYAPTWLTYDGEVYIRLIKGILFMSEGQGAPSMAGTENWNWASVSAYLPFVGILPAYAYCKKRRDWIRKIIVISLIMSCVPFLTSIFFMLTIVTMRWWHMPVLMMILATLKTMDDPESFNLKQSCTEVFTGMTVFIIYLCIFRWSKDIFCGIIRPGRFLMTAVSSGLGFVITPVLIGGKKRQKVLMALICVYSVFSTAYCISGLKMISDKDVAEEIAFANMLPETDNNYRYRSVDNYLQYVGGAMASGCYSSTVNGGVFRFNKAFGYERNNVDGDWGYDGVPGLYEYVGAAYAVYRKIPEGYESAVISEMEHDGKKQYVLKGAACPIARTYDRFMYRSEFDSIDRDLKGIVAINCLILPDGGDGSGLIHINPDSFVDDAGDINGLFYEGLARAESMKLSISERSDKGFRLSGPFYDDSYAFIAVPASDGWSVCADGKPVPITEVCGFTAVKVNGSINELSFKYETPGRVTGAGLSSIGGLLLLLYCMREYRYRNRNRDGC